MFSLGITLSDSNLVVFVFLNMNVSLECPILLVALISVIKF